MSNREMLLLAAALAGLGGAFSLALLLSLRSRWPAGPPPGSPTLPATQRRWGPPTLAALSLVGGTLLACLALLLSGLSFPLALGGSLALAALLYPAIQGAQRKQQATRARLEAIQLTRAVYGRLRAGVPLFEALAGSAARREGDGSHALAICGADLAELVQAVGMGEPLPEQLHALGQRFAASSPELEMVFRRYGLMAAIALGAEAQAAQAEAIAEAMQRTDRIRRQLEAELSTSRNTRLVMALLMAGLVVFLAARGGIIGQALLTTTPGHIALAFALVMLLLAQLVAGRIEQMDLVAY